jgi:hypothetical protein
MPQDEGVIPAKLGYVSMLGDRQEPPRKATPNLKGLRICTSHCTLLNNDITTGRSVLAVGEIFRVKGRVLCY